MPVSLKSALKRHLYRSLLAKRRMVAPSFGPAIDRTLSEKQDYFRYATLALALTRLDAEQIPGALAEVGVYRGETSRVIRAVLPDRRLFLFDTFEGFPAGQLEAFQRGDARFRDTSVDAVRSVVGDSDRVLIRKGLVPETLRGLEEERFAFVLLDVDLFEPTMASLAFFYPRLSPGGYLVVHDYNNPESDWACKRALDEFLHDKPEGLVEIADVWGSALVRKSKAI